MNNNVNIDNIEIFNIYMNSHFNITNKNVYKSIRIFTLRSHWGYINNSLFKLAIELTAKFN